MQLKQARLVLDMLKTQAKKYKNKRIMAVLTTPGTSYERRIEARCKNTRVSYFEQLSRVDSGFAISCIRESTKFELFNITEGIQLRTVQGIEL